MLKEYLSYFAQFSIVPVIVASLIGLMRYRRLPPSLRYLTLLACFDVLMELTALFLYTNFARKTLGINSNLFLFPFVFVGETTLLALAYRQVLQSAAFNKMSPWLLGLFSAYALIVGFSLFGLPLHSIGLSVVANLLMLGLAGLYFSKLLNELQVEQLLLDPFFWVSASLTIYGLGNLLISLFSNYMLAHCSVQLQFIIMWGVRNVFNYLLYLSYCWALWIASPQSRSALTAAGNPPRA